MPPIRGTKLCAGHTPGKASEAGKIGGPRRRLFNAANIQHFNPPSDARDLVIMLATTLVETRELKIEPRVANAFFVGCGMYLHALELVDLAEELKELKEKFRVKFGA
jgi:hypothetical protein